jgi:hypothetical protein
MQTEFKFEKDEQQAFPKLKYTLNKKLVLWLYKQRNRVAHRCIEIRLWHDIITKKLFG